MISDFETACLRQKFDFRDGQKRFGCIGSLCVEVKWVISLLVSILVKKNSIEKQVTKPSENEGFAIPWKHTRVLKKKLFGPMSFDEKIMGRNKIKYLPIILEAKLRLYASI